MGEQASGEILQREFMELRHTVGHLTKEIKNMKDEVSELKTLIQKLLELQQTPAVPLLSTEASQKQQKPLEEIELPQGQDERNKENGAYDGIRYGSVIQFVLGTLGGAPIGLVMIKLETASGSDLVLDSLKLLLQELNRNNEKHELRVESLICSMFCDSKDETLHESPLHNLGAPSQFSTGEIFLESFKSRELRLGFILEPQEYPAVNTAPSRIFRLGRVIDGMDVLHDLDVGKSYFVQHVGIFQP
ncbi:hypothetical protein BT69DRAFT_1324176 [Atractiella rhizophila]|nr:hypothetical protein BT69DRAFT_1324176 [Atractiella rhizophila]